MKDRREINIEVFEDTMKNYKSNPTLKAAVSNSVANQKFTAADETVELPQCAGYTPTVTVCEARHEDLRTELCLSEQSRRRCYSRLIGTGRINLPLLDAVPLP